MKKPQLSNYLVTIAWAIGILFAIVFFMGLIGTGMQREQADNCFENKDVSACADICESDKAKSACSFACQKGDAYSCSILSKCDIAFRCYDKSYYQD